MKHQSHASKRATDRPVKHLRLKTYARIGNLLSFIRRWNTLTASPALSNGTCICTSLCSCSVRSFRSFVRFVCASAVQYQNCRLLGFFRSKEHFTAQSIHPSILHNTPIMQGRYNIPQFIAGNVPSSSSIPSVIIKSTISHHHIQPTTLGENWFWGSGFFTWFEPSCSPSIFSLSPTHPTWISSSCVSVRYEQRSIC